MNTIANVMIRIGESDASENLVMVLAMLLESERKEIVVRPQEQWYRIIVYMHIYCANRRYDCRESMVISVCNVMAILCRQFDMNLYIYICSC